MLRLSGRQLDCFGTGAGEGVGVNQLILHITSPWTIMGNVIEECHA